LIGKISSAKKFHQQPFPTKKYDEKLHYMKILQAKYSPGAKIS
jgi:hypothetical protein